MSKNLQDFPDWSQWLRENLERGCNVKGLIDILNTNEFSNVSINNQLNEFFLHPFLGSQSLNHLDCRLTRNDNDLNVLKVNTEKLPIYVIDNFLSDAECHALLNVEEADLVPSPLTYDNGDKEFRTSSTSYLNEKKYPIILEVDKKISETLGIPLEFAESTQMQRYKVGQQFKQHRDPFDPYGDTYDNHAKYIGNRTWTFMVYLNNVSEGGETHFPKINKIFKPNAGRAIIWNSLLSNGEINENSLHAGLPIIEGEKSVITKWFRQLPKGK